MMRLSMRWAEGEEESDDDRWQSPRRFDLSTACDVTVKSEGVTAQSEEAE